MLNIYRLGREISSDAVQNFLDEVVLIYQNALPAEYLKCARLFQSVSVWVVYDAFDHRFDLFDQNVVHHVRTIIAEKDPINYLRLLNL